MDTFILLTILSLLLLITLSPKIGLYLMAICLPMIGNNFYLYNSVIPLIDLITLITLIAFLLNSLYQRFFNRSLSKNFSWPIFIPFLLFFIANLISIVLADNFSYSFYYFLRWPFFLYFGYIFLPINIITDTKILKKVVILVFSSTLLVLLSGYLSLFYQSTQDAFFRMTSLPIFNIYPFGENHNLIAEFLNVGVFFILVIKEFTKKKRYRRLIDVIFALTVLGIILTFSRTAWITLIIQLAVYLFYRLKHKPQEKRGFVIISLLVIILASPLIWRMSILQNNNSSSTASRALLNDITIEAWQEKPLFGHGSGSFIDLVDENIRFKANYGAAMDSHGFVQKILVENGLFGLISWLFILIYLTRFALLAIKKYHPKVKWVLPFALAAFGGIFFQFFNTSYYKGKVWLPIILFLIAIEFSEKQYAKINKNSANHPQS